MNNLEMRLAEKRKVSKKLRHEAFSRLKYYRFHDGKVARAREEWLGLCEAMKICNHKNCNHSIGLILLKERLHDKYRALRLKNLQILRLYRSLLIQAVTNDMVCTLISGQLRKFKEDELCSEM